MIDIAILKPRTQDYVWSVYNCSYPELIFNGVVGGTFIITFFSYSQRIFAPLSIIGRLSLLILIIHMYILDYVAMPIWGQSLESYVATIVITTLIAWLMDKYVPWLTGKKRFW